MKLTLDEKLAFALMPNPHQVAVAAMAAKVEDGKELTTGDIGRLYKNRFARRVAVIYLRKKYDAEQAAK